MDLRTPLLIVHCLGFALGLGGATILDLMLLRSLRRRLGPAEIMSVDLISGVVAAGLAILVASGLGFIALYAWTSPFMLANPKLWAKAAVVGVLAANGAYIHARVLPAVRRQAGRTLFEDVPARVRVSMLTAAAVSCVSWHFSFLLGLVRELNFATPAGTFLAAYGALLALTWCALQLLGAQASATPGKRPLARGAEAAERPPATSATAP